MLVLRSLALVAVLAAPLQCPSRATREMAREDRPDEALWSLSERFARDGDDGARQATLRFLVERYPSSRFSVRAALTLDGAVFSDAAQ